MPLRRARSDRVFEGPIVSTLKTIVGSFLDPSRAGGSVTVRFSTQRIKNADFRVYVDPGYQHARSQIRINLIWSISAFSNSSLRAERGSGCHPTPGSGNDFRKDEALLSSDAHESSRFIEHIRIVSVARSMVEWVTFEPSVSKSGGPGTLVSAYQKRGEP